MGEVTWLLEGEKDGIDEEKNGREGIRGTLRGPRSPADKTSS